MLDPQGVNRYLCERCGGTGVQEGSHWDMDERRYIDKGRVQCELCNGDGYLGTIPDNLNIARVDPEPAKPAGAELPADARFQLVKAYMTARIAREDFRGISLEVPIATKWADQTLAALRGEE